MPSIETVQPAPPSPLLRRTKPALLVSVRDATEARAALAGGADVIDVKEPLAGPLGAPTAETVAEVCDAVRGTRPVTVAAGDLDGDAIERVTELASCGVAAVKIGLAGHRDRDWKPAIAELSRRLPPGVELVPAAYADARSALAPGADEILVAAAQAGLRWLLLDTYGKNAGGLFSLLRVGALLDLLHRASRKGVAIAFAGGLTGSTITRAAELRPALIGVRGAACRGDRLGRVEETLVSKALERIELASFPTVRQDPLSDP